MSLVQLANGEKFEIEEPSGVRLGILRQKERKILPLVFRAGEGAFENIKEQFSMAENTERIRLFYPEETEETSDEVLEEENGPAYEEYEGFTLLGEVREEEKIVEEGTLTRLPVYGRRLTIELGQRQYGE